MLPLYYKDVIYIQIRRWILRVLCCGCCSSWWCLSWPKFLWLTYLQIISIVQSHLAYSTLFTGRKNNMLFLLCKRVNSSCAVSVIHFQTSFDRSRNSKQIMTFTWRMESSFHSVSWGTKEAFKGRICGNRHSTCFKTRK